ncbi:MAG: sterol carrier family protein [Rhodoglobus sp.]
MPPKRIPSAEGRVAVVAALAGDAPRATTATAVRYLLQRLAETAEGGTVEIRVPPHGAVQAVEGPRHTRGTPPNVVEMDAATWLHLATGRLAWAEAVGTGRVAASGSRADLAPYLPVEWETMEP